MTSREELEAAYKKGWNDALMCVPGQEPVYPTPADEVIAKGRLQGETLKRMEAKHEKTLEGRIEVLEEKARRMWGKFELDRG